MPDDEYRYVVRRIWVRSTSGMYAQYDGYVDVHMHVDDDDYFGAAVKELARTSFPDRKSRAFWIFERMEEL